MKTRIRRLTWKMVEFKKGLTMRFIMKTGKEFFERLSADESFAGEVNDAVAKMREAGAQNYYETIIPVAAERGYEVTKEELDEINERMLSELSEEELAKLSGGAVTCLAVSVTFFVGVGISYLTAKYFSKKT